MKYYTLVLLLFSGFAMAEQQVFYDPTEPYHVRQHSQWVMQQKKGLGALSALGAKAGFNVTFILLSHNRKMAVINDEPVFIGDLIGGYKVTDIKEHSVTLEKNNKTWTIDMIQPIIQN